MATYHFNKEINLTYCYILHRCRFTANNLIYGKVLIFLYCSLVGFYYLIEWHYLSKEKEKI